MSAQRGQSTGPAHKVRVFGTGPPQAEPPLHNSCFPPSSQEGVGSAHQQHDGDGKQGHEPWPAEQEGDRDDGIERETGLDSRQLATMTQHRPQASAGAYWSLNPAVRRN